MAACPLAATGQPAPIKPLIRAHAHNDYEHPRPLLDALEQGFCSVEADIHLIEGQLLVAHDRDKVAKERTLQALYLDPLQARVTRNNGRVYRDGPAVILLIDFKSEATATYSVLRDMLRAYAPMLTQFTGDGVHPNAVTVIISGNRPRAEMEAEHVRLAALDGRPEDLENSSPAGLIPLVSQNWKSLFQWRGAGPFPDRDAKLLRQLVEKAHAQGRKIRFWGTPDVPAMWSKLFESGVDLLNTDDLTGMRAFLEERQSRP